MTSKVYFIKTSTNQGRQNISEKARKLFTAANLAPHFHKNDFTAVKVHVGEHRNNTYLPAPCIKGLVDELLKLKTKPFLTDTTTLYSGKRHNALDHTHLACQHGFSKEALGIPFICADGLLGTAQIAVKIDGQLNKEVFIAPAIVHCQSILSIAHFTGHCAAGAGATLKTLGMGCASKKGKMKQHAALTLSITDDCTLCRLCLQHCPAGAITLRKTKARIDKNKCIACAQCLALCRFDAVKCNWGQETKILQKNIAEYALGALKAKQNKAAFFNFLLSVTKDCDCSDQPDLPKIADDIGILASTDPVAVDKAALDLIEKTTGKKLQQLLGNDELDPQHQIRHAQHIGLGTTNYELIHLE